MDQEIVDSPAPGQPVGELVGSTPGVPQEAPKETVKETVAPEKTLSRRETIEKVAKDLQAKRDGGKTAPSAPATNAAGRAIDPSSGRFVKADGSLGEKAPQQSSVAPAAPEAPKRVYPKSWKPELEADYHKLPAHIIEQIEKRESDIFKGIEEYKKQAMPAELRQVLGPREQSFVQQFGSVHAGLQHLFQLSDFAARDPQGFVQWFAQQRGVQLGNQATPEGQAVDPNYSALQAEIAGLKNQLVGFQQQSQQAAMTPYLSEVERFKSEPGHEKFDELRPHMAALVQSGAAQTLQEAYDQAYRAKFSDEWLNAQLLERQKADQQRAQQAKQAAVQVTGAPSQATPPSVDPKNRRAVIEAAIRNVGR
jgi:hypothetical protein